MKHPDSIPVTVDKSRFTVLGEKFYAGQGTPPGPREYDDSARGTTRHPTARGDGRAAHVTKWHSNGGNREVGWSAATWEGARREQMRRWAALPLERAILALEEMEELARAMRAAPALDRTLARQPVPATPGVAEHAAESRDKTDEAGERQSHR